MANYESDSQIDAEQAEATGEAFTAANTEIGVEVVRVTGQVAFPVVAIPETYRWSCFERRVANTPRIARSAAAPVTLLTAAGVPDVPRYGPAA